MTEHATHSLTLDRQGPPASAAGAAYRPLKALALVSVLMLLVSLATAAASHDPQLRWWSIIHAAAWSAVLAFALVRPGGAQSAESGNRPRAASPARRESAAETQKFQALADFAPIGIFQTTPDGANFYVNDRWCELTGLSREHSKDRGWVAALHPEDRERVAREWYQACADRREFAGDYRYQRPDGSVVWVIGHAKALQDSRGEVTGYLGAVVDITSRKELESQLRDSISRHADLAEREELLRRELDHRVRNNLGSLLGLLRMYERATGDAASLAVSMRAVVGAMNDAHQLISSNPGGPVVLEKIVQRLVADASPGQVTISGPEVPICASQINALAMVLQELASNSRKHGALSQDASSVAISWTTGPSAPTIELRWTETASNIAPPATRGVGLTLIETLAKGELRGSCCFDFRPGGLLFTLRSALETSETEPGNLRASTRQGSSQ